MIGILLKDSSYEQDIRELLMAFYPGESFAHEEKEDVSFYVTGEYESESGGEGYFCLRLVEEGKEKDSRRFAIRYGNRLPANRRMSARPFLHRKHTTPEKP